jgi:eukaryotic-like serine/threonine-protein kinase
LSSHHPSKEFRPVVFTCLCACGRRWTLAQDLTTFQGEVLLTCPACGRGAVRLLLTTAPPSCIDPNQTVGPAYSTDDEVEAENVPENTGTTLGAYELLSELGRGGMGVVYKARQKGLDRIVALKMILAGSHAGQDDVARFRVEAEAIARLQHPHIVQVHDIGEHDGQPYFSLEFCAGGSLEKKLRGKPLPPREAASIVELLARAIQVAHDHSILHRDLKPANVLLTEEGTPKITDFGLAKKLDELGQGRTRTGAIVGTPSYMAPEQAAAKKEIGPAADVYALGAILYECLVGRPPFQAATALDTILQVMAEEPVPPRRLNSKVPRDLEVACMKCLAKAPRARYARAADLADDLHRFLEGEPIRARPPGLLRRTWRTARKKPIYTVIVVLISASAILGVVEYVRTKEVFKGFDMNEAKRIRDLMLRDDPRKPVSGR